MWLRHGFIVKKSRSYGRAMNKTIKYILGLSLSIFCVNSMAVISPSQTTLPQASNISQIVLPPKNISSKRSVIIEQLQAKVTELESQLADVKQELTQLKNAPTLTRKQQIEAANAKLITLTWRDAKKGDYPQNAFVAGYDGKYPIYICHVNYLEGVHPGQLTDKGCYISYKHQAFVKPDYQVLAGSGNTFWAPVNSIIPSDSNESALVNFSEFPVIGGYEDQDHHHLYICRTIYDNRIHVGKVVSGRCNIGVDNIEIVTDSFEVLSDMK